MSNMTWLCHRQSPSLSWILALTLSMVSDASTSSRKKAFSHARRVFVARTQYIKWPVKCLREINPILMAQNWRRFGVTGLRCLVVRPRWQWHSRSWSIPVISTLGLLWFKRRAISHNITRPISEWRVRNPISHAKDPRWWSFQSASSRKSAWLMIWPRTLWANEFPWANKHWETSANGTRDFTCEVMCKKLLGKGLDSKCEVRSANRMRRQENKMYPYDRNGEQHQFVYKNDKVLMLNHPTMFLKLRIWPARMVTTSGHGGIFGFSRRARSVDHNMTICVLDFGGPSFWVRTLS